MRFRPKSAAKLREVRPTTTPGFGKGGGSDARSSANQGLGGLGVILTYGRCVHGAAELLLG